MGLRAATISSTSSSTSNETAGSSDQKENQDNPSIPISSATNASGQCNMAPALNEPLSQTNKLSSSATSASPRPTSNNLLTINNNSTHNNVNSSENIDSNETSSIGKRNKDITTKGAFQLVFEEVVAKQTAASAATRHKRIGIVSALSLDRTRSNNQMGPMCDTNSSVANFDDNSESHEEDKHMDYSNCDNSVGSQNDKPLTEIAEEEHHIEEQNKRIENENIAEEELNQPIIVSECDNHELHNLEANDKRSPPHTPPTCTIAAQNSQIQSQTTPASSLTPQSTTSGMGLQKDFIKDSADMDQVLGEFSTSDMDLLQVLKGFDTTPGGEAALCDLAGSLGLFNDVDVMNYEDVGVPAKDNETKEIRNEIEKRQQQMQRKCDFLLRRLRKMQSRYMGKHTSEEVAGLFEWGANPVLRRKDHDTNRNVSYEEDKRRFIPTASMKAFIRRIDSVATAQHSSLTKRSKAGRPSNASLQSDLSTPQNKIAPVTASIIPPMDEKITEEIAHVSGMLQTELKEVQSALDSDVTASSSGGESADEMVTYNNPMQQPLSISKRASWKWARDRASIASRWTWLLAQISDLEYRIRQHNELHHQIKKNKGAVTFEKISSTSSQTLPSSVNGYRGVLPGNSKAIDVDTIPPNGAFDSSANNTTGSCRTRPFQRAGFRKRKLLQTANVHTVSKKAARPSTVKCGCQWPLHPCALCTGRSDPTAPRDLPDTMTPSERVALLDPGFHPVLSFPEDVSHSIHFEATMRLPEWQNRVIRCSTKPALKGAVGVQKAAEREDRSKKFLDSRRKYNRKYQQDIMAANKLKNAKNRRSLHGGNHLMKNKHRKLVSSNAGSGGGDGGNVGSGALTSNNYSGTIGGMSSTSSTAGSDSLGLLPSDNFDGTNGILPRSKNSSPTPGNYSGSSYKNERMDRRNRNSYDIDNIVIPYSVAASTRVELLPYKEIPTPKWRVIEADQENKSEINENENSENISEKNNVENINSKTVDDALVNHLHESNEDDDSEDISDEAIQSRHDRALMEERKKFQTYLKFPWSTRSRANRRIDSRAESSGANTPDPTSPAPNTPSVGGDQESIPSPAAPSTPQTHLDSLEGVDSVTVNQCSIATPSNPPPNNSSSSAARRAERKRTISLKKEREFIKEETGGSNTSDVREIIPPYEPLKFPLPDELYDAMLQMMPNDHQLLEDCSKAELCDGTNEKGDDGKDLTTTPSYTTHNNVGQTIYTANLSNFDTGGSLLGGDSDTDSAESGLPDEDPNDPEWREPA